MSFSLGRHNEFWIWVVSTKRSFSVCQTCSPPWAKHTSSKTMSVTLVIALTACGRSGGRHLLWLLMPLLLELWLLNVATAVLAATSRWLLPLLVSTPWPQWRLLLPLLLPSRQVVLLVVVILALQWLLMPLLLELWLLIIPTAVLTATRIWRLPWLLSAP